MPLFGTSGVRGIVGQDLSLELCEEVALSLAATLPEQARVCLATDTRTSREAVKEAIFTGLLESGIDVVDLGILPTPALACLTREWRFDAGIMVTASHNPPEYNGIKLFNSDTMGYGQVQEHEIERIYHEKAYRKRSAGSLQQAEGMREAYLDFLRRSLFAGHASSACKVLVDAGNGAASGFVTEIFTRLGLQVIGLNDIPDGRFPGRNPEPNRDSLQGTVDYLRETDAELAVCFDGDADRVVFCDKEGFWGFNEPTAFISRLVVGASGKTRIASTVESGKLLDLAVQDMGVIVVRGKVGDVHVAQLAKEIEAPVGTEQVGVYIIPEVGYYPESIYAALVLINHIGSPSQVREFFKLIPELFFEQVKIPCTGNTKKAVMAKVQQRAAEFGAAEVNTLDGVRLEFGDSWMLIRASGTEPVIRVMAESTSSKKAYDLLERGSDMVRAIVGKDIDLL